MVMAAFVVYQCTNRPMGMKRMGMRHPKMEQRENLPPDFEDFEKFEKFLEDGPRPHRTPPPFVGEHDILSIVVLLLMFGANLGTKYYFRSRRDQRKLQELEKQNLEQQLEYLKYQINPHFLMNTLNNIHALVDIDPEQAKETIVELSKIMRYALYEGARQRVPLGRDIAFLEGYVRLMRLRYTDKVDVRLETPEQMPDVEIPPMIFITFVENAFKHGVSYQQQSFICAKFEIQDSTLCFTCKNSKPRTVQPQTAEKEGGVGLQNALQRLQLIYGNRFALNIDETPETYNIRLEIPLY
jgi:LytS/YehU family sensor histidine kinase